MRVGVVVGFALLMSPAIAGAQSRCGPSASQVELTACAGVQLENASARLTRVLDTLRTVFGPERTRTLTTVQGRWREFADAHCTWVADAFIGGSIQPMIAAQCRTMLTEARIRSLSTQLCEGSGLDDDCAAARRFRNRPWQRRHATTHHA